MRLPIVLCAVLLTASYVFAQGFAPEEAVRRMKLPPGFEAKLVASEPDIAQPVCIEFDDRGRLWVIQYLQYPNPAGLNRVKVDRYSRTVYDKIPEPPPHGTKGADRITIVDQFDDNGRAHRFKDFVNGLNLASGLAFGHGGVFVLQVPYLLFYPDRNHDDVPDSDPEVLLTGFGMEDAHSVANSLTWGPDGWLYGCQGSTVTARIHGIEFQQGVWRYHPVTHKFELFCEGGGNSWGLDFDEDGNLIYSTNLGPYRMLHGVQGGYYWKSFGKHGALHNPYTYGYFDHVPYSNFTGGHVTDGGIIYQGDQFPTAFRGKYIANDLLGHAVQWHNLQRNGSTFNATYGGELLTPHDTWFAPSDLTMGPEGSLYVADWYDKRTAHPDPDADWDRSNGRIYQIRYNGTNAEHPTSNIQRPTFDKANSKDLVKLLGDSNDWNVRWARHTLADRRDKTVLPELRKIILQSTNDHLALESLWALYVSGGLDNKFSGQLLQHRLPQIRSWTVRLIGDKGKAARNLLSLATTETNVMVRSQLASTAKRLPASEGLAVAGTLALHDVNAKDPYIPLLLWWAVEAHCVSHVEQCISLFATADAWRHPVVSETIAPRLMRRYGAEGTSATVNGCAEILERAPANYHASMLAALNEGLQECTNKVASTSALETQLALDGNNVIAVQIAARLGQNSARRHAIEIATNTKAPKADRLTMLKLLADLAPAESEPAVLPIVNATEPESVQIGALEVLQHFDNPEITTHVLANYAKMPEPVRSRARDFLLTRKASTLALLQQVDTGKMAATQIPLDQLRRVSLHKDQQLNELVRKHWGNVTGGTPEEKLAVVRRFNNDLRAFPGDPARGHDLFVRTCGVCHQLFGEGTPVGPDLTHANRQDRDFLLVSIVDPSAVIRKEFLNYNVELKDGSVLSGLIVEQNPNSVTLAVAKNERTTINRSQILSLRESAVSLMPEGLLQPLKPQELRDLFSYLQK
ncbi:MAG: PVC-type heme-binding CxxCH protein [Limisphaerales bacterium]